ncbi:MAG: pyrroline-5-carboxylate reductase [Cyanobium sp. CZS 48M]|nr:pyrroline-5-carboxylate reductase [Cyanobium sp. CZS48M]
MSSRLGVIGLGRMARALLLPLLDQGVIGRDQVQAVVASEESARRLQAELGVAVGLDAAPAWAAPVVLLAVKPQLLAAVSAGAPAPAPGSDSPLLISVLAGVSLERLQRSFPGWRCVRTVPNTPCLVGAGITGLAWGDDLPAEQRQWVLDLFARVGVVKELPEGQLDGLLAVASSGPALAAVLLEALADGGVAAGLPRPLALELALGMMKGSIKLLQDQGLHPAQLKDMVASPAGTTIAALRQLEQAGVRSALIEAVLAAAERSRALNNG